MRAAIRATAILGTLMMTFVLSRELSAGVQDPSDGELRKAPSPGAQIVHHRLGHARRRNRSIRRRASSSRRFVWQPPTAGLS